MRRRWAISRAITRPRAMARPTLAAVPPNNSRSERDTGAFSSDTGTPTWTDHPSVPASTRWTVSTSMPSRVCVRAEFEPPRAMASCTAGVVAPALAAFDVRRARDDFLLGVDDGAGPSVRQSRLAEDRTDLVGQQADRQDITEFTIPDNGNRRDTNCLPMAAWYGPSPPSTGFRVRARR